VHGIDANTLREFRRDARRQRKQILWTMAHQRLRCTWDESGRTTEVNMPMGAKRADKGIFIGNQLSRCRGWSVGRQLQPDDYLFSNTLVIPARNENIGKLYRMKRGVAYL
jgi:YD repeat-containing protein